MKLNLAILTAFATVLLFSSCGKEPEPIPVGPSIRTVLITVTQDKWAYSHDTDNNYFYATVKMPEITNGVFDNGLVKMYRTYDYDKANAAQIELPYVRLNEYVNPEDKNDVYFWTETVDYEFGIGTMTIYYTASDFDYELNEDFVPEAMQFRCVVMY